MWLFCWTPKLDAATHPQTTQLTNKPKHKKQQQQKTTTKNQNSTNSFIGTMEYMAPEVVDGTGHGKVCVWLCGFVVFYFFIFLAAVGLGSQLMINRR